MKKKILHISQADGGVAVYLQMLLRHLDKLTTSNSLICAQQFVAEDFKSLVDNFYQIEMSREISPIKDCKAILMLRKLIKIENPDIVYCHSSKAGALGRIAAIGLKKKIVYNAHGWAFNMKCSKSKVLFYKWIEKCFTLITDKIVCISDFERESALKNGVGNENKLQVIYNGVDVNEIKTNIEKSTLTRQSLHIHESAFVVGMIGRISKQKAPDTFVKMAVKVKETIPQAYFMIVGDGDERNEIENLIQKNNLQSSFFITGWVTNPNDYMALFDVGVLLSRWEGFGYAIIEYMVAQKPLVATKVDAIPNLIRHEENGLLVDVDDYESAANQVSRIYSEPALCEKLRKNGCNSAIERYTIERVAAEHKKLFENI